MNKDDIKLKLVGMSSFEAKEDREDFLSLLLVHIPLYYEDVDSSFGESIVSTHLLGYDPVGHFTKRKVIYRVVYDTKRIGYTVITEKRGGAVKIGPTVLYEGWRGLGIGTHLRQLISQYYATRNFRKAYSTVADNKLDSYRYLVKSGYSVEAHLRYHYSQGHGELVFGQLLAAGSFIGAAEPRIHRIRNFRIETRSQDWRPQVKDFMLAGMADAFSEIDDSFVEDVFRAEERGQTRFADKGKTVFVAHDANNIYGVAVTTSKRGGATKVAPLLALSPSVAASLVSEVNTFYRHDGSRKIYMIIPYHHSWLIRTLAENGYVCEGLLREPYKWGVDMRVMSEFIAPAQNCEEWQDIVLSILPDPVQRIFNKTKCFELRKQIPDRRLAGMYLYTTGSVQAFTGYVRTPGYFRLEREALWRVVGTNACTRERFDEYFRKYSAGFAICISEVCVFRHPIPLAEVRNHVPGFVVPRQFNYLESGSALAGLLEEARAQGDWFKTPVRELIAPFKDELHSYE